jgi:hypothetical protein
MNNRREFVIQISMAGSLLAANSAWAQSSPLAETDAPAAALGYKQDALKADKKKYPKYASGQQCSNCALYQGKAGEANGPCPLFAGKSVASKGWCSAWAKKP